MKSLYRSLFDRYRNFHISLYEEASSRAISKKDGNAMLEVALYNGYGIGTKQSWDECVSWIRKAASVGVPEALVFMRSLSDPVLDRHDETNANYEISPDNLFQALIDLCQQYHMEGLYDEHFRIAKILRIKDSERYQGSHRNICQCFCTLPNERSMLPTGPFEDILYRLWRAIKFFRREIWPQRRYGRSQSLRNFV